MDEKIEEKVEEKIDTKTREVIDKHNYSQYLIEQAPNTNPNPKRVYTIEIKRAIYSDESFEIFKKYEEHVHGKSEKKPDGFKRFLC
jgi:arginyl-tRNA--protein-N-Asp/Glu arginylyltransferase